MDSEVGALPLSRNAAAIPNAAVNTMHFATARKGDGASKMKLSMKAESRPSLVPKNKVMPHEESFIWIGHPLEKRERLHKRLGRLVLVQRDEVILPSSCNGITVQVRPSVDDASYVADVNEEGASQGLKKDKGSVKIPLASHDWANSPLADHEATNDGESSRAPSSIICCDGQYSGRGVLASDKRSQQSAEEESTVASNNLQASLPGRPPCRPPCFPFAEPVLCHQPFQ